MQNHGWAVSACLWSPGHLMRTVQHMVPRHLKWSPSYYEDSGFARWWLSRGKKNMVVKIFAFFMHLTQQVLRLCTGENVLWLNITYTDTTELWFPLILIGKINFQAFSVAKITWKGISSTHRETLQESRCTLKILWTLFNVQLTIVYLHIQHWHILQPPAGCIAVCCHFLLRLTTLDRWSLHCFYIRHLAPGHFLSQQQQQAMGRASE